MFKHIFTRMLSFMLLSAMVFPLSAQATVTNTDRMGIEASESSIVTVSDLAGRYFIVDNNAKLRFDMFDGAKYGTFLLPEVNVEVFHILLLDAGTYAISLTNPKYELNNHSVSISYKEIYYDFNGLHNGDVVVGFYNDISDSIEDIAIISVNDTAEYTVRILGPEAGSTRNIVYSTMKIQTKNGFALMSAANNTLLEYTDVAFQSQIIESVKADSEMLVDVDLEAWYAPSIDLVRERGIMPELGKNAYLPDDSASRGQIVSVLYNLQNKPSFNNEHGFTDVSFYHYISSHSDAISWASEIGLVLGYGDGRFSPNHNITREQFATILWRYNEVFGLELELNDNISLAQFSDSHSISEYAREAMMLCIKLGLFIGNENTELNPQGNITRAEVAQIIARIITG